MKACIGVLAIGQTPRPDLEAEFRRHAGEATVLVAGALDGLTSSEIASMAEQRSDYPLQTLLADGTVVNIPRAEVTPRLSGRATELAERGAAVVVLACAGDFKIFECPVPLILPGRVVPAVVGAIAPTRRVGIVTSTEGQEEAARRKWEKDGFTVTVVSASPFVEEEMYAAASALTDSSFEVVVLDCMGHGPTYRSNFARHCGRPVVAAQTLVAGLASEIASGISGGES